MHDFTGGREMCACVFVSVGGFHFCVQTFSVSLNRKNSHRKEKSQMRSFSYLKTSITIKWRAESAEDPVAYELYVLLLWCLADHGHYVLSYTFINYSL